MCIFDFGVNCFYKKTHTKQKLEDLCTAMSFSFALWFMDTMTLLCGCKRCDSVSDRVNKHSKAMQILVWVDASISKLRQGKAQLESVLPTHATTRRASTGVLSCVWVCEVLDFTYLRKKLIKWVWLAHHWLSFLVFGAAEAQRALWQELLQELWGGWTAQPRSARPCRNSPKLCRPSTWPCLKLWSL